ncbi:hypothetical protein NLU13_9342 [Sarocladium strictum]|uniref:DUF676 domain-containing protein n=1 Tax=Sarocladium strictum TaxID=5046 RepID=A0AA39L3S3_SARSR|nr:hypothetical protein NLU13_9342 [Sarocladium strictum]
MWASLNKAPPAHFDDPNARPTSSSASSASALEPPPRYSAQYQRDYSDPRQSSQHSLVPSEPDTDNEGRRTLLVIYIHGFNGNSQSFRSFPAHVHNFLKNALSETHVVHTKLYPRYKTYRAVEVARDKFSEWLEPHEGPNVDVILVGHSMGGILAADVILMPNHNPNAQQPFKHRILGHVSLDCPFLGLHPGIIVSGIASLFQPSPQPPQDPTYIQPRGSQSTVAVGDEVSSADTSAASPYATLPVEPRRPDPHFNPPFFNDQTYEERPFLQSVFSFIKKHHAEGVANSFAQRLVDQLEFGGCLADYTGLHARYKKLRALEDVDEVGMIGQGHPPGAYARVRFVNYYTLSSGIPKKQETPEGEDTKAVTDDFATEKIGDMDKLNVDPLRDLSSDRSIPTPRSSVSITVEDCSTSAQQPANADANPELKAKTKFEEDFSRLSMQDIDPTPMSDSEEHTQSPQDVDPVISQESLMASTPQRTITEELALPPLPEEPTPPVLPDLGSYADKSARKQAEKESKRLQKAYEQAVKDRAKSIREREKMIEKRRKDSQKAIDKQDREAQKKLDKHEQKEKQRLQKEEQRMEKEMLRMEKEAEKLRKKAGSNRDKSKLSQEKLENEPSSGDELERTTTQDTQAVDDAAAAPKKRKKFCTLPRKVNGKADEAWVDIYMENMTEVTAHCGLFFAGPHYDGLVGEVGSRIVGWVHDDLTKRVILEMPVD